METVLLKCGVVSAVTEQMCLLSAIMACGINPFFAWHAKFKNKIYICILPTTTLKLYIKITKKTNYNAQIRP